MRTAAPPGADRAEVRPPAPTGRPAPDGGRSTGGRPLPTGLRRSFEPRFGYDFGDVRIHTGAAAADSARALHAHAFTLGRDIVFGDGEYSPHTTSGRRLIAHELVHVVQQGGEPAGPVSSVLASPRVQRAEIDDRPIHCRGLADSTSRLDDHVNGILAGVRHIDDGERRVRLVYQALGVGSPFSAIEQWCEDLPETHQRRIPIERSRYRTTLHGRRTGSFPIGSAWLRGESALGTLLNIGGHCIGSDKLGHFFQQGRDYFHISETLGMGDAYAVGFGRWLEGGMPADPDVRAWIERMNDQDWPGFDRLMLNFSFWQGVFGLSTTGVFSRADLEANRAGMEFYKRVHASPDARFSARAYITGQWNETVNPSCFGPQMARLVAANDPQFLREYRAAVRRAVRDNPYAMSAYHAQGIFESLVEPYVRRYRCP